MSTGSFDINTSANNLASFSSTGARIGLFNDNHVLINNNSVNIEDGINTFASFSTATWIGEKFGQRMNLDKYGLGLTLDGIKDIFSVKVEDVSQGTQEENKQG